MADGVVYTGFDPAFGDPLNRLIALAKARGYNPQLISGRRDAYGWPGMKGQSQADLYNQLGKPGGPRAAAAPGYSPHQYGLAGDVTGIPQSLLEQLAPQFGLRAIHSDPNHLELANWQKTAATQPPMTAWNESNPANVPSQMAMNMEAGGPPGTKINGSAPTPGALSAPSSPYGNSFLDSLATIESGNQNIYSKTDKDVAGPNSRSQGYFQINTPTWSDFAPKAGVDLTQFPNAMSAPADVQAQVARDQRADQQGLFDLSARRVRRPEDMLTKQFASLDPKGTIGANAANFGSSAALPVGDGSTIAAISSQAQARGSSVASSQAGGPRNDAPAGTVAAANQRAADNQSLFGKFTQGPIDPATGKPTPGAVTPMAQIADAILNNTKNTQAKVDAAGPERTALSGMQAPMARNVSPMGGAMLPNVAQTYGQTLNSFARPLSYDASPPQAPQMAAAGFRGGFGPQAQGVSLNSLPPLPQGFPGQIRPLTLDEYGYQGAGYAS